MFRELLASADPSSDVQLSCSTRKGNRLQVQTTDPAGHRRFDQVQGLACCWPSRATIWRCCASMARRSRSLHLRARHPALAGPAALSVQRTRSSTAWRAALDSEILLGSGMAGCSGMAVELEVKQPDASCSKAPATDTWRGSTTACVCRMMRRFQGPLDHQPQTAAGSRFRSGLSWWRSFCRSG